MSFFLSVVWSFNKGLFFFFWWLQLEGFLVLKIDWGNLEE